MCESIRGPSPSSAGNANVGSSLHTTELTIINRQMLKSVVKQLF